MTSASGITRGKSVDKNFSRDSCKQPSFPIYSKLGKIIFKHDIALHEEPGVLWGPAGMHFPFFSHRSLQWNFREGNRDQHHMQKCSASPKQCAWRLRRGKESLQAGNFNMMEEFFWGHSAFLHSSYGLFAFRHTSIKLFKQLIHV